VYLSKPMAEQGQNSEPGSLSSNNNLPDEPEEGQPKRELLAANIFHQFFYSLQVLLDLRRDDIERLEAQNPLVLINIYATHGYPKSPFVWIHIDTGKLENGGSYYNDSVDVADYDNALLCYETDPSGQLVKCPDEENRRKVDVTRAAITSFQRLSQEKGARILIDVGGVQTEYLSDGKTWIPTPPVDTPIPDSSLPPNPSPNPPLLP
jgi:hypothetical protein